MRKVAPGERLRIPARDYNAFVDAARFVESLQHSSRQQLPRAVAPGMVRVVNCGGVDVPRYGLLYLTGVEVEGLYRAERPKYPFLDQLAIAACPVAAGAIGVAWCDALPHPVLCYDADEIPFPSTAITQAHSFWARRHPAGNIRLLARHVPPADTGEPLVLATVDRG